MSERSDDDYKIIDGVRMYAPTCKPNPAEPKGDRCPHDILIPECYYCYPPNPAPWDAEPKGACVSEGVPKCMKCSLPVANKFTEVCEACKANPESSAREWTLRGWYEPSDNIEGRPIYKEEINGPRIIEGKLRVIEISAFERLQADLERSKKFGSGEFEARAKVCEILCNLQNKHEVLQIVLEEKEAQHKAFCEQAQEKTDADFKLVRASILHAETQLALANREIKRLQEERAVRELAFAELNNDLANTQQWNRNFVEQRDMVQAALEAKEVEYKELTEVSGRNYGRVFNMLQETRAELADYKERDLYSHKVRSSQAEDIKNLEESESILEDKLEAAREREGKLVGAVQAWIDSANGARRGDGTLDGDVIRLWNNVEKVLTSLKETK